MKIEKIKIDDKDYPQTLRKIENPPKQLYVIGNKELLNNKAFAIVGSRNCSEEGKKNARIFAKNIAKAELTIVSGMAKGIDTAAHIRSNRS